MKPFSPSNTSRGPVTPRPARNVVRVTAPATLGYARPFQWDSRPVRVTRSALNAVPAIAIAWAVRASSRPSARATPAATAYARSEEHTSELQSPYDLVCRFLLEKNYKYIFKIV